MTPSGDGLDASVVWTVIRASHLLQREVSALFASFGLTPVQFGVLTYLSARGAMTSAEIARSVLVRPQSIAGVLNGLEQRRLLQRQLPRARGSANPIQLTDQGAALVAEIWPAFRAFNEPGELGLSERQSADLQRTLKALIVSLGRSGEV